MKLKNKIAVITGGASGIGRETALLFLSEGSTVIICDIFESSEILNDEFKNYKNLYYKKMDVSQSADVDSVINQVISEFGRIDILVNNAGITSDAQLKKMSEEQFDKVLSVNLKGVFNCTKAVVNYMIDEGSGVILSASSIVGLYGNFGQTNYAASKFGVIGMTKTWSRELAPKGIRVNAVAPGFILTSMTEKMPQNVLDMMKEKTPLKRLGHPNDIAKAYLFLASDDASFITGTVLSVDGGLVL